MKQKQHSKKDISGDSIGKRLEGAGKLLQIQECNETVSEGTRNVSVLIWKMSKMTRKCNWYEKSRRQIGGGILRMKEEN